MKGVIYTRVSSDEQIEGTSLDSQEALCRAYCTQKGIEVVGLFREEGESAKDLSLKNRSQFLAALEFCRAAKDIGAFIVFKVDRFARSTEDHFSVRRVLRDYGTTLYSVTEPIGDKPAEKFIETVLAGAAEYDNALRKERCTGGMISRLNQGIWPWKPPIGYVCAKHKKHGEKKTVPDRAHPELFPMIQRGLRAYAAGAIVSQATLTRQLNLWGFASAHGRRASNQLVNGMLTRHLPFYAGRLVNPWTRKEVPGLHVPMISDEDYDCIRARRLGKLRLVPARRSRFNEAFPLRRLLRCSACSRFLTGAHSRGNGGKYPYYFCHNRHCSARPKSLRGDLIHQAFRDYLHRLALWPKDAAEIEHRVLAILGPKRDRPIVDRDVHATKLAELIEKRRRICEMREDGAYDDSLFRERLAIVDNDIRSLKADLSPPQSLSTVDPKELTASIRWLLPRVALWWEKTPLASRPRFDKVLFPNGIVVENATDYRTTDPGPIFSLFRERIDPGSLEVHLQRSSSNQLYAYFKELIALYRDFKDADSANADLPSAV